MRTLVFVSAVLVTNSFAVTRYVALNGGNVAPYTNWAMAATTIQAAVDVASSNEVVLVSNGVYSITSPISVSKAVTIASLSGPIETSVRGNACRGFLLSHAQCVVSGFTVTNCSSYEGSAFRSDLETTLITDCSIIGNTASAGGAASRNSTLNRCQVINNQSGMYGNLDGSIVYNSLVAYNKGAAAINGNGRTMFNCTIVSNSPTGAYNCKLVNCISYYNIGANWTSVTASNSCSTPQMSGAGNLTNKPNFVGIEVGDFHLRPSSPCIDAGVNMPWMVGATDLDGNPRLSGGRVDMGAFEHSPVEVVITTSPATVAHAVTSLAIAGTNSGAVGMLWASNAANGLTYSFAAEPAWTSPAIALEVGANAIGVYGTNEFGVQAQDSVVLTRKAATPTGVAASDGTFTGKVVLAWLAAPGAASYRVLRAETNDSASAATIANAVSNTVYDDTTATPGLLYYYWVIAQQNGVEGDPSAPDSGYRQLAASSRIDATLGYYTNNVVVSWSGVEGATKYRVYRADSALTNIADLIGSDITATNYTDNTVTPGLVYYYWVQAQSAVAASAWSATTPGYALLAANFADKKTWSMRDTKKMDTLTCKQLPGPWSTLFNASWSVAIVNVSTHEIVSGPFELVTKNGKKYTYKSALATITYTQNYNKRKDTYKCKLIFKFAGAMPTQPGVFLQRP
jgi:hypothetical protein